MIARSVPVLKLPEKIILSSRNISVTKKLRVSAENIGKGKLRVSALPSSWPLLSTIVLPVL